MSIGFICPVCGYADALKPAYDGPHGAWSQEICPSCGTQFDLDDDHCSHAELRAGWMAQQATWSSKRPQPRNFDALAQLQKAGLIMKMASDASGWFAIFRDIETSALWELSYPAGEMHGGGPRHLAQVQRHEIEGRYPGMD